MQIRYSINDFWLQLKTIISQRIFTDFHERTIFYSIVEGKVNFQFKVQIFRLPGAFITLHLHKYIELIERQKSSTKYWKIMLGKYAQMFEQLLVCIQILFTIVL